jgi:hypothetical protein
VSDGDVANNCSNSANMRIDAPLEGQLIQEGITIRGWAIHRAARSGTGVDVVQIYLDGPSGAGGEEIALPSYGDERADIAAIYGERYRYSGYHFDWGITDVASGSHALYVYIRSTVSG